jgi:hypothetical protein
MSKVTCSVQYAAIEDHMGIVPANSHLDQVVPSGHEEAVSPVDEPAELHPEEPIDPKIVEHFSGGMAPKYIILIIFVLIIVVGWVRIGQVWGPKIGI